MMGQLRVTYGIVLLLLLLPSGEARAQNAERLTATLSAIAAGDGSSQRRAAILSALSDVTAAAELQPFGDGDRAGVNVVVTVPGPGAETIIVGAHYDRVAIGQGAVDNGGACAALVELVRAFTASPLARHTLKFVFFDREEAGLQGSRAYFAANTDRPAFALNLDIFAYGDSIFATASNVEGALLRSLRTAASAAGIAVRDAPVNRYPASDHHSMIAAGIETLGIALIDTADIDGVLGLGSQALVAGKSPRILTIIHTPRDTMSEVRADQVVRAIPVIEQAIRTVDRAD
jgi:aminopeptidase S